MGGSQAAFTLKKEPRDASWHHPAGENILLPGSSLQPQQLCWGQFHCFRVFLVLNPASPHLDQSGPGRKQVHTLKRGDWREFRKELCPEQG